MKKSIAVLFAAGIFMLSSPVKNNSAEAQVEDVNSVPAVMKSSLATKSVIPPVRLATPSPLPTSETTTVPEMKDSAAEALPHSSQPEPNQEISSSVSVPAPAHVHEWVPVKTTVHIEAVMEEVKVVDVPGTKGHFEVESYNDYMMAKR